MPAFGMIECENVIGCVVPPFERMSGTTFTAAELNVRPIVKVYPHQAPDNARQGDTPSRPARVPIVTFQSIASILSVQKDIYDGDELWAPVHVADTTSLAGFHTERVGTWNERTNIRRPESQPYGSRYELGADDDPSLLIGVA